jgi:hypothetical protein
MVFELLGYAIFVSLMHAVVLTVRVRAENAAVAVSENALRS